MAATPTSVQERRKFPRRELPPHVVVSLLQPARPIHTENVNFSEGGLCLRLDQMLEVRSLVQLQVTPSTARKGRPMKCRGRVTWVMQRQDLRTMPPFLFDTGIEFVDPPPAMRQYLVRLGVGVPQKRSSRRKVAESTVIRGRTFVPRLERTSSRPSQWHLVVSVDGVACFSDHYPSERAAITAWAKFKRQQAKR